MAVSHQDMLDTLSTPAKGEGVVCSHGQVLQLSQALGFAVNWIGTCYGLATVASYACIADNMEDYQQDLALIAHMRTDPAAAQWYENFSQREPRDAHTAQAKAHFWHVLARLGEIYVMHNFTNPDYAGLVSGGRRMATQRMGVELGEGLFVPRLDKTDPNSPPDPQKVVVSTASAFSCYTQRQLKESLIELRKICQSLSVEENVGFLLNGEGHTISISYRPREKKWFLYKDNPPGEYFADQDFDKMVAQAINVLGQYDRDGIQAIETQILCQAQHKETVARKLSPWIDAQFRYFSDAVRTSTMSVKTALFPRLLSRAVLSNDVRAVRQVITRFQSEITDRSALYYVKSLGAGKFDISDTFYCAVAQGNPEIVNLLFDTFQNMEPKQANTRQVDRGNPFCLAIMQGNTEVVRSFVDHEQISSATTFEAAPFVAAEYGCLDILRLFHTDSWNFDYLDAMGKSLMVIAAEKGHMEVVNYLLKNTRYTHDNNKMDHHGFNPLTRAIKGGHFETVKLLVERGGVDLDCGTVRDRKPLYVAASEGQTKIVEYLLAQGAPWNQHDSQYDPLMAAIAGGHTEVVKLMLAKAKTPPVGSALLDVAAKNGHLATVDALLGMGMRLGLSEQELSKQLYFAANQGNVALLRALLHDAKNISALQRDISLIFYLAALRGQLFIVEELIKWGVPFDLQGSNPQAMLTGAIGQRNIAALKALIYHQVDVNQVNVHGLLPLHAAVCNNYLPSVQLLLEAGAEVHALGPDGMTALHYAAGSGSADIAWALLNRRAALDVKDKFGQTPLLAAASNGNTEVMPMLIRAGADVNAQDNAGQSPLIAGVRSGHMPVLKYLLQYQGDNLNLNIRDISGRTALWHAVDAGHIDMVKLLLRQGALVNIANTSGVTPLMLAQQRGNPAMRQVLSAASSSQTSTGFLRFFWRNPSSSASSGSNVNSTQKPTTPGSVP